MTVEQHAEVVIGIEEALLAAQHEFPEMPKDKQNTHYGTRYSSLDAIVSSTRPSLVKHQLLLTHEVRDTATGVSVTAVLEHIPSKQKRTNLLSCDCERTNPQKMGSAITYLRRYTAAPLLGITPDEDDDGNAAKPESKQQSPPRESGRRPSTRQQNRSEKQTQQPTQQTQAQQNFELPPGWPETPLPQIADYLKSLKSWSAVAFACGLVFGKDTPIKNDAELVPLWDEFYAMYLDRFEKLDQASRDKVSDVAEKVEQCHSLIETIKQGSERF